MTFDELNLMAPLRAAVRHAGYEEPTPIQAETIPLVLAERDVLGCAQTGTGKTAAFALPILQLLAKRRQGSIRITRPIKALILTPTRELAQQIYENFLTYGDKLGLRACVIFGGVGQKPQTDALERGIDILVATPGRLNDLIGQGFIDLSRLEIFVLDEADRMLDMGFIHDVRRVMTHLPKERQTLFFSATMPKEVEALAQSLLTDPATVKVDPPSSTVEMIEQSLYMIDKANKKHLLAQLIKQKDFGNVLVFIRTKHGCDRVVKELKREKIEARAIHGDKSQSARQDALKSFKSGQIDVLVATDIAARGIDIQGLSHVVNYDMPNEPEAYVHRIGRTGRAGLAGDAISFCCIDETKELAQVEKLIGFRIPLKESDWPMEVFTPTVKEPRGPRPSKLRMDGTPAPEKKSFQPRRQQPASKKPQGGGTSNRSRSRRPSSR